MSMDMPRSFCALEFTAPSAEDRMPFPAELFSMSKVFAPFSAADAAAKYPDVPAPTMTTSKSRMSTQSASEISGASPSQLGASDARCISFAFCDAASPLGAQLEIAPTADNEATAAAPVRNERRDISNGRAIFPPLTNGTFSGEAAMRRLRGGPMRSASPLRLRLS